MISIAPVGIYSGCSKDEFTMFVDMQEFKYTILKSLADFMNFDSELRKIYPQSQIPDFPTNYSVTKKRRTFSITEAFSEPTADSYDISHEEMSDKLELYVKCIMTCHELVASKELYSFLFKKNEVPMTLTDILLEDKEESSITVHSEYSLEIQGKPNEILVWQFKSINFDIAFSVAVNGMGRIPYARYSAQNETISGILKPVQSDGLTTYSVKWDNSYAIFRSKDIKYKVAVIDGIHFDSCKLLAEEKMKFHVEAIKTQDHLKLTLLKIAANLFPNMFYTEQIDAESIRLRNLYGQNTALGSDSVKEVEQLHELLDEKDLDLEDLETEVIDTQNSRDAIFNSWKYTSMQLEVAVQELTRLKSSTVDMVQLQQENRDLQFALDTLRAEMAYKLADLEAKYLLKNIEKDHQMNALQRKLGQKRELTEDNNGGNSQKKKKILEISKDSALNKENLSSAINY